MSSSPSVEIRAGVESDTHAVCAFGARHVIAFYTPLLGADAARSQVARWWSDDEMRPALRNGDVVVAVRGGDIVGVAQIDPVASPPIVYKLYVDPALRSRGIGPRLLRAVSARVPPDATHLAIEHFTVNERAARFYEREGFLVGRVDEAASADPLHRITWRVKRLR